MAKKETAQKKETAPKAQEPKLTKKQLAEQAAKEEAAKAEQDNAAAAEAPTKGKGKAKAEKPAKEPTKTAPVEEEETDTEAEEKPVKGKPRSLGAIAKAISKKILASAKASVEIGLLLSEGKSAIEFKHSKGATKVFLEWAEQEFGIKKAQAYSYLKIASVFGSEDMQEKFATVPMMVLSRLTMNDAMLDAAMIALEEGVKVDIKWMKEWMEEQKEPEEKEEKQPKSKGKDADSESDEEEEEEDTDDKPSKRQEMDDKLVAQLEEEIETLKGQLSSASAGVVAQDHFQAVAKRMSKLEPYQVLGVAPDADKKAVKAAMRDMVKLYHPDIVGASGAEVVEMVEAAAKAMTK